MSFRVLAWLITLSFGVHSVAPAYAQTLVVPGNVLHLPAPGTMVVLSAPYQPALIKGLKVHPQNPLEFDFIVDSGDSDLEEDQLKQESERLVKYFLAGLTIPEEDLWVNLSPYEQQKVIHEKFAMTDMGRDLLAQDYVLKQLTASLIYPEKELGAQFWKKIKKEAYERYGTTDIPMNTFNKVWVVPEKAVVYEKGDTAFVVESRLKVMLEEDYLAAQNQSGKSGKVLSGKTDTTSTTLPLSTEILKELILPALDQEINHGENFAKLRQIYHSLILAAWFKQALKESLLGQIYVDQEKVIGIDLADKKVKEKIYQQYLEAYKKGVYNYIKEDYDPANRQVIPRKYFSGGFRMTVPLERTTDEAMIANLPPSEAGDLNALTVRLAEPTENPLAQTQIESLPPVRNNFQSPKVDAAIVGETRLEKIYTNFTGNRLSDQQRAELLRIREEKQYEGSLPYLEEFLREGYDFDFYDEEARRFVLGQNFFNYNDSSESIRPFFNFLLKLVISLQMIRDQLYSIEREKFHWFDLTDNTYPLKIVQGKTTLLIKSEFPRSTTSRSIDGRWSQESHRRRGLDIAVDEEPERDSYNWYLMSFDFSGLQGWDNITREWGTTIDEVLENLSRKKRGPIHWIDIAAGENNAQRQLLEDNGGFFSNLTVKVTGGPTGSFLMKGLVNVIDLLSGLTSEGSLRDWTQRQRVFQRYITLRRKVTLTAIDLEDRRVRKNRKINFIVGDVNQVGLPENGDFITMVQIWQYLSDPLKLLVEAYNKLSPDGILLIGNLSGDITIEGESARISPEDISNLVEAQLRKQYGSGLSMFSPVHSLLAQKAGPRELFLNARLVDWRRYEKIDPAKPLLFFEEVEDSAMVSDKNGETWTPLTRMPELELMARQVAQGVPALLPGSIIEATGPQARFYRRILDMQGKRSNGSGLDVVGQGTLNPSVPSPRGDAAMAGISSELRIRSRPVSAVLDIIQRVIAENDFESPIWLFGSVVKEGITDRANDLGHEQDIDLAVPREAWEIYGEALWRVTRGIRLQFSPTSDFRDGPTLRDVVDLGKFFESEFDSFRHGVVYRITGDSIKKIETYDDMIRYLRIDIPNIGAYAREFQKRGILNPAIAALLFPKRQLGVGEGKQDQAMVGEEQTQNTGHKKLVENQGAGTKGESDDAAMAALSDSEAQLQRLMEIYESLSSWHSYRYRFYRPDDTLGIRNDAMDFSVRKGSTIHFNAELFRDGTLTEEETKALKAILQAEFHRHSWTKPAYDSPIEELVLEAVGLISEIFTFVDITFSGEEMYSPEFDSQGGRLAARERVFTIQQLLDDLEIRSNLMQEKLKLALKLIEEGELEGKGLTVSGVLRILDFYGKYIYGHSLDPTLIHIIIYRIIRKYNEYSWLELNGWAGDSISVYIDIAARVLDMMSSDKEWRLAQHQKIQDLLSRSDQKEILTVVWLVKTLGFLMEIEDEEQRSIVANSLRDLLQSQEQVILTTVFPFAEQILEEAESQEAEVFFLYRGSWVLKEILEKLAEARGIKNLRLHELYFTRKMMQEMEGMDRVDQLKYLYDQGLLKRQRILLVETGFLGTVVKHILELVTDQNVVSEMNGRYGLNQEVLEDSQVGVRMLSYSPAEGLLSQKEDFSYWGGFASAQDLPARTAALIIDELLEFDWRSPDSLTRDTNGKMSVVPEGTLLPRLRDLSRHWIDSLLDQYLTGGANEATPRGGESVQDGRDMALTGTEKVGGVDYTQINRSLQIKRDGQGLPLPVEFQNIETLRQNTLGFIPIIIKMTPVQSLPLLLGISQTDSSDVRLSHSAS